MHSYGDKKSGNVLQVVESLLLQIYSRRWKTLLGTSGRITLAWPGARCSDELLLRVYIQGEHLIILN